MGPDSLSIQWLLACYGPVLKPFTPLTGPQLAEAIAGVYSVEEPRNKQAVEMARECPGVFSMEHRRFVYTEPAKKRRCYIARYPLDASGDNLKEEILFEDTHYNGKMMLAWLELIAKRKPSEAMLQMWYTDGNQVDCLATTNQPFHLS